MNKPTVLAILGTAAALFLTACSTDTETAQSTATHADATANTSDSTAAEAFPVTIHHAFGETTIPAKPARIATVGWSNNEVPLSLGLVPVGMDKATWGDDDNNGILPWVEEKITELGGQTPVLFDTTDSIPFEAIADTKPDVILAAYSGLKKEDYEQLSKIAPTVAYPEVPWGTPWDQTITINATAMGEKDQGEKLVADLKDSIAGSFAAHPELAGKKALFMTYDSTDMSKIGFYNPTDPRMGFLVDAGMQVPSAVTTFGDKESFFSEVSSEKADEFSDVDVIISYGSDSAEENRKALHNMQADPLLGSIPAIAAGKVLFLDNGPSAAVANPSALNIPWGTADYFDRIAAALNS